MLKISVIIPVYNVEHYVAECLESVINQSFDSYEIICVDDMSTDNSMKIVEKFAKKYSKVRLVKHSQNLGLSAARNTGIRNAMGKYILFVDSDDMIVPGTLEELFEMAENNSLDILYFNMKKIYEAEMKMVKDERPQKVYDYAGIYNGPELFSLFMQNREMKIEACRQLFKREFLVVNNLWFYEGILHEDNLFSFFCAMGAKRVMNINREYYLYRQRSASIMSTMSNRRMDSMYIICVEIFKYWNTHQFTEELNQAIECYFDEMYQIFLYQKKIFSGKAALEVGTYAERHLYKLLNSPTLKYASLSERKIALLKDAPQIIVFGAGRAAIDVLQLLEREHIKVSAVAVSDVKSNAESVCGIKVRAIEEFLQLKKEAYVVIGVTKKFYNGVKEQLEGLGFENLISVNDEIV